MHITFEERDGIAVAAVAGSADAATAPELAETLGAHIADGAARMVADLSGLEYSSSAGLRALLGLVKQARRQGGDLRLAAVQDRVRRVLDLSGFDSIIRSYEDVDGAVTSFTS